MSRKLLLLLCLATACFHQFLPIGGITESRFDRNIVISSPGMELPHQRGYAQLSTIMPRVAGEAPTVHSVVVTIEYRDVNPRSFYKADGEGGVPLDFTPWTVNVCAATEHCRYHEMFGATLPDRLLRVTERSGYAVMFSPKSGIPIVVTISAEQMRQHLAQSDSVARARGVAR